VQAAQIETMPIVFDSAKAAVDDIIRLKTRIKHVTNNFLAIISPPFL
jgi:hypothetical protein